MSLFRYEGKKLLHNPLTLVLIAVLLVAGLAQPLYDVYQYRTVNQQYQNRTVDQIIAEYEKLSYSPLLQSMEGSEYENLAQERKNQQRVVPDELLFVFLTPPSTNIFPCPTCNITESTATPSARSSSAPARGTDQLRCLQSLKRQMNTLARTGNRDTYEYLLLQKQVSMMYAADVTGVQYNHFWVRLEETTSGIMPLLAAVMVLLLSGVFSREYDTGMYRILTATPMGKRRSMLCKVGIATLLGTGWPCWPCCCPPRYIWGWGPRKAGIPPPPAGRGMVHLYPYALEVWQYFLYKLLYTCLGMAAAALMASYLSLRTRTALYAATLSCCCFSPRTGRCSLPTPIRYSPGSA